jgi:hypothetical protein
MSRRVPANPIAALAPKVGAAMACEQLLSLERAHDRAAAEFDEFRNTLEATIGRMPQDEFVRLSKEMDKAWDALLAARYMLFRHFREHGCKSDEVSAAAGGTNA